jgi:hypothetical protein
MIIILLKSSDLIYIRLFYFVKTWSLFLNIFWSTELRTCCLYKSLYNKRTYTITLSGKINLKPRAWNYSLLILHTSLLYAPDYIKWLSLPTKFDLYSSWELNTFRPTNILSALLTACVTSPRTSRVTYII